ncbi:MAG: DUF4168 domain-containing protein [Elusimicrobiota bacterium]
MSISKFRNLGIAGLVVVGLMACSSGEEKSAEPEQETQAEAETEANQQEAMPQQPEAVESSDIEDEELEKFSEAMESIRPITSEAQSDMAKTIEDSDVSMERYQEVTMAQQQGQEADLSAEEEQQFQEINEKLQKLQTDIQEKQIKGIEEAGLDVERFQQISNALQQDPELQQRFSEITGQNLGGAPAQEQEQE